MKDFQDLMLTTVWHERQHIADTGGQGKVCCCMISCVAALCVCSGAIAFGLYLLPNPTCFLQQQKNKCLDSVQWPQEPCKVCELQLTKVTGQAMLIPMATLNEGEGDG